MSAADVAREIRTSLPGTEDIVVDYLSGYLVDDASAEEDVLQITRSMLESFADAAGKPSKLDELITRLGTFIAARINARNAIAGSVASGGPRKLEKAMEMGRTGAMSNTIAFSEGVDLESINKSK